MTHNADFYQRSLKDRDGFGAEPAQQIDWQTPPQQIREYSKPLFARWFVGGTTNLCHNAVDRRVKDRAEHTALIAVSTETNTEQVYTIDMAKCSAWRPACRNWGSKGRSRVDLHAHGGRGGVCHAGMCTHWRGPLCGVWWFCRGFTGIAY